MLPRKKRGGRKEERRAGVKGKKIKEKGASARALGNGPVARATATGLSVLSKQDAAGVAKAGDWMCPAGQSCRQNPMAAAVQSGWVDVLPHLHVVTATS